MKKLILIILISFIFFSTAVLFSQEAKVRVIKEQAVLRLKPSNESIIIRELPLGSELIVEETVGEWIKIKMPPDADGIVIMGYIHKSFVEFEIKQSNLGPEKEINIKGIDNDYTSWRSKLDGAKARKYAGNITAGIGALITSIGTALYFLDPRKDTWLSSYYLITTYERKKEYLVVMGGGFLFCLVALITSEPARSEIGRLELEGAKKGYNIAAGLNIINGGPAFQITFSF